eukprot:CAMPEP_0185829264 /NCGR_PEP_ID=MMETSP1353-20130828/143_1 /TAXON_ID=1077150 /ORGANISM="Erythrolobus australicus, Strain CCMP3124" /LENGTH=356 /DNA_ID=CAMNT_0028527031 /DNA_START=181 /DNA_END=1251 /DNA_ORIENTATION=-
MAATHHQPIRTKSRGKKHGCAPRVHGHARYKCAKHGSGERLDTVRTRIKSADHSDASSELKMDAALDMPSVLTENGYRLERLVNSGGQGKVYAATDCEGEPCAVKVVKRNKYAESEVALLGELHHRHVLQLYDVLEDDANLYIVTELLEGQDLFDALTAHDFYSEREILYIAYQVLAALKYLHARGCAHRDIKLENFVFAKCGERVLDLKLIDFGLAIAMDSKDAKLEWSLSGTSTWQPPEQVLRLPFDPMAGDMWSFGILLYTLATKGMPFKCKRMEDTQHAIVHRPAPMKQARMMMMSSSFQHLVSSLLQKNPARRPTADEALRFVEKLLKFGVEPVSDQERDADMRRSSSITA